MLLKFTTDSTLAKSLLNAIYVTQNIPTQQIFENINKHTPLYDCIFAPFVTKTTSHLGHWNRIARNITMEKVSHWNAGTEKLNHSI